MAKFRVIKTSFINNAICSEGDVIEYDGIPSDNLEAIDKPALKAVELAATADQQSLDRQNIAAAGGNPDTVASLT